MRKTLYCGPHFRLPGRIPLGVALASKRAGIPVSSGTIPPNQIQCAGTRSQAAPQISPAIKINQQYKIQNNRILCRHKRGLR
jgi:hypothetical protein